jgi:hypothetical protein
LREKGRGSVRYEGKWVKYCRTMVGWVVLSTGKCMRGLVRPN